METFDLEVGFGREIGLGREFENSTWNGSRAEFGKTI